MRITLFLLCLLAAPTLTAQTLPEGPQRFWLELQIGASTQQPNCGGCLQPSRIGGPTATAALGATITQRVGVALLVREFDEFSLEESHSGKYLVGLGQYLLNPGQAVGLTVNAGLGAGGQHGDAAPNGDNGTGVVVAGGLGMRLPARTTFGLTINVDLMKSVTGNVRTTTGPGSSYRPLLSTVGLGLNIASSSQK